MKPALYSAAELARFREVQAMAYRSLTGVASSLKSGQTEREVVAMLDGRLRDQGVRSFFHVPFAWFGDRTAFVGVRTPLDFFPTTRRLRPGMPVILDVAPVLDGYVASVAYAFAFGDNAVAEQAAADLEPFRELIAERVNRGDAAGEIYRAAEDLLVDLGYRNCHRKHPFGLLGHRVQRTGPVSRMDPRVFGFSLSAAGALVGQSIAARLPHRLTKLVPQLKRGTPFVNVGPGCEERLDHGLWVFEPHIARNDVGAKWKEMLVVGEDRARWLDDSLPHVQRWNNP